MSKDILIVDDEPAIREVVSAILEDEGYRPREAANAEEALREVARRPPALAPGTSSIRSRLHSFRFRHPKR